MTTRELIALGTSSQVPTRERSQNAYYVRWDDEGFLFDPGENTQRQLTFAGISASSIHCICISHFHGDHCLGLAGIIQRLSVDHCQHPVHLYYPESGQCYVERLCNAAIFKDETELVFHPVPEEVSGLIMIRNTQQYVLTAHYLDHSVPVLGFRIAERDSVQFLPEKLAAAGIHGPMISELEHQGHLSVGGRTIHLEEVTIPRLGNIFAFVMDTRPCPGVLALAESADLLLMEATYTSEHQELACLYAHSTARDAAKAALSSGASQLALGHFSQRYKNLTKHLEEASSIFSNVVVLNDMDHVEIRRRSKRMHLESLY
jgi:ribonuclease Z